MKNIRKFLIIFILIFLVSCGENTANNQTTNNNNTTGEVTTAIETTNVDTTTSITTTDLVTTESITTEQVTTTEDTSFTITFDSVGGQVIETQTISNSDDFVLPGNPSKLEHVFDGWYMDSAYTIAFNPDLLDGNNVTLYAKWIINQYDVVFLDRDDTQICTISVDYGTDLSTIDYPGVYIEGYVHIGWGDVPLTMPGNDITLKAEYEVSTFTVNYYLNDELYSSETVIYNNLPNLPVITGDDYFILDGWYLDHTKLESFEDTTLVKRDYNLYAYDLINYDPIFYTEYNRLYGEAEVDKYVGVIGIVTNVIENGYVLSNGYYSVYVYSEDSVTFGDELKVLGVYTLENNQYSIKNLYMQETISTDNGFALDITASQVMSLTNLNDPNSLLKGKLYQVTASVKYSNNEYYLEDSYGSKIYITNQSSNASLSFLNNYVDLEVTIEIFYFDTVDDKVYFGFDYLNYDINVEVAPGEWYEPLMDVNDLIDSMPSVAWSSLDFPITGPNGSDYVITSNDHEMFNDAGGFLGIRSETRTVTFTVTATKSIYSYTSTFDVIVPRELTFDEYYNSLDDYYYIIEGIVYTKNELGAFIHDGNNNYIFISSEDIENEVNIGDMIRVMGHKSVSGYYELEIVSSSNPMPSAINANIKDFYDDSIKNGQIVNLTCSISVDNLNRVYLGNLIDMSLYVHDASHTFPLLGFDGEYVNIQVVKYNGRYVFYEGISDDVTIANPLSDLEKIDLILDYLDRYMPEYNNLEYNMHLPTSTLDSTITWHSSNSDVITDLGEVTMIMGASRSATLTATITMGDETATASYVVTVRDMYDMSPTSIHFALIEDDGVRIKISGYVVAIYEDRFYLQNGDDFLYINTYLGDDFVTGDLITIWGEMSTSNSTGYPKREMINATLYSVETTYYYDSDPIVLSSPVYLGYTDQTLFYYSKLYQADLTIVSMDDGTGLAHFACFGDIHIVFNPDDYIPYFDRFYEVGDTITLEFIMHEYQDGNVLITNVVFPELLDGYIAWLINDMTDIPYYDLVVTEDIILPTYNEAFGVALNWSSNKPDIISNTGQVTRPLNGEGDQTVYLHLSFIYNGNHYGYSHEITVPELPAE
ncbi:immunoglobulin-like domain-containing protein [Candidatus Izemoplasma sp. B36]|uniref:immunoglobulin-like domain-containing protein n=1 Tax=Candidatus Izemoplasma sp. B36 TaxID=3242468 RepID=UPI003557CEA4